MTTSKHTDASRGAERHPTPRHGTPAPTVTPMGTSIGLTLCEADIILPKTRRVLHVGTTFICEADENGVIIC